MEVGEEEFTVRLRAISKLNLKCLERRKLTFDVLDFCRCSINLPGEDGQSEKVQLDVEQSAEVRTNEEQLGNMGIEERENEVQLDEVDEDQVVDLAGERRSEDEEEIEKVAGEQLSHNLIISPRGTNFEIKEGTNAKEIVGNRDGINGDTTWRNALFNEVSTPIFKLQQSGLRQDIGPVVLNSNKGNKGHPTGSVNVNGEDKERSSGPMIDYEAQLNKQVVEKATPNTLLCYSRRDKGDEKQ
ncbi:hypothetical protein LguiB_034330 [Lonicera macranthoides]